MAKNPPEAHIPYKLGEISVALVLGCCLLSPLLAPTYLGQFCPLSPHGSSSLLETSWPRHSATAIPRRCSQMAVASLLFTNEHETVV